MKTIVDKKTGLVLFVGESTVLNDSQVAIDDLCTLEYSSEQSVYYDFAKSEFYLVPNSVWTLESHEKQLLEEHTAYCEQLITSLGYIDRVDMNTTAIADNEYKEEASLLAQYWTDSYAELMEYIAEQPTEQTQKTLEQIITPFNN